MAYRQFYRALSMDRAIPMELFAFFRAGFSLYRGDAIIRCAEI